MLLVLALVPLVLGAPPSPPSQSAAPATLPDQPQAPPIKAKQFREKSMEIIGAVTQHSRQRYNKIKNNLGFGGKNRRTGAAPQQQGMVAGGERGARRPGAYPGAGPGLDIFAPLDTTNTPQPATGLPDAASPDAVIKKHRSHARELRNPDPRHQSPPLTTTPPKVTTTPEARRQQRISRFMNFIIENRSLLKQFIQQKTALPGVTAPLARTADRAGDFSTPPAAAASASASASASANELRRDGANDHTKARKSTAALKAAQLDMAGARGSRIAEMRAHGRMCQRHVLNPEGPKYDSKGKAYVTEFISKENIHFLPTKRPVFVIPVCCNCCAKSVLGCE